jgi:hypothetical protein
MNPAGGARANPPDAAAGSPGAKTAEPEVRITNPITPERRQPAVTGTSRTRYVGAWSYPPRGGQFHGPQPDLVELEVREENGRISGTLTAQFTSQPNLDPMVAFSFAGDMAPSKNQLMPLMTGDGAKGLIELIPGSAFNLLEITFRTEFREGKINMGNFVLVMK